MRPALRLLDDGLIDRILNQGMVIIAELGVDIHNPDVLARFGDHGARVDRSAGRAWVPWPIVDRALAPRRAASAIGSGRWPSGRRSRRPSPARSGPTPTPSMRHTPWSGCVRS